MPLPSRADFDEYCFQIELQPTAVENAAAAPPAKEAAAQHQAAAGPAPFVMRYRGRVIAAVVALLVAAAATLAVRSPCGA